MSEAEARRRRHLQRQCKSTAGAEEQEKWMDYARGAHGWIEGIVKRVVAALARAQARGLVGALHIAARVRVPARVAA